MTLAPALRLAAAFLLAAACAPPAADPGPAGPAAPRRASEWPSYGGDPGGSRFARQREITRANVAGLEVAWTYHTRDGVGHEGKRAQAAFENTPILVDGTLFLCTPRNRVIALDPATGAERWRFDPEIDLEGQLRQPDRLPRRLHLARSRGRRGRRVPAPHPHRHQRRAPVRRSTPRRGDPARTSAARARST